MEDCYLRDVQWGVLRHDIYLSTEAREEKERNCFTPGKAKRRLIILKNTISNTVLMFYSHPNKSYWKVKSLQADSSVPGITWQVRLARLLESHYVQTVLFVTNCVT